MDKQKLAKDILEGVGGEENVESVVHCMTRLRFKLYDESVPNKEKIQKLKGVKGVTLNGGQYQVIIGNEVADVYEELVKSAQLGSGDKRGSSAPKKKQNWFNNILETIASCFTPLLPALAGAGMVKALLAILTTLHVLSEDSGTYQILNVIGDGIFHFLPILLAISAARRFKSNEFIAATIAAAMLHPNLLDLKNGGASTIDFLGLNIPLVNYASTVIPILLTIWLTSYVEKFVYKRTPNVLKIVLAPLVVLLVMIPLALYAIGPVGTYAAHGVTTAINFLFNTSGLLAGFILGGSIQALVITGMHYGLIPIIVQSLAVNGYDYTIPATFMGVMGQAGAILGVLLRTKNKELKSLSGSSLLSALLGITEPGIYGVTLRLKKPFYAGMIGGDIGGAIPGAVGAKAITMAPSGLQSLPIFAGPTFVYVIIGIVVSFTIGAVVSYLLGFKEPDDVEDEEEDGKGTSGEMKPLPGERTLYAPLNGTIIELSEVSDPGFAAMGKGLAIIPDHGRVIAPFQGKIATVAKTKHAVAIVGDDGTEVLIHVGVDTVKLKGEFFTTYVQAGDEVQTGDVLLEFEAGPIKAAGYDTTTSIVITNSDENTEILNNAGTTAVERAPFMTVIAK
ncbi:beta-glucoside-specific PTS transporter subunit IIABC [Paenibacillus terrae]|uniref:beta-glucoside-specific PTS transporter subunit IIABC n=1 Tax=Paenibacillus terrae TaxID=159743 RepID=UPI0005CBCBC1|nr:beta-glucoside-specific PTS transporter subunit IIABC [Paenibacillus terrae]